MPLTQQKAIEFQRLLREECGLQITLEGAWERATKRVSFYRRIIGPIPEDPGVQTSNRQALEAVDWRIVVE
jgi:hypothetical protein